MTPFSRHRHVAAVTAMILVAPVSRARTLAMASQTVAVFGHGAVSQSRGLLVPRAVLQSRSRSADQTSASDAHRRAGLLVELAASGRPRDSSVPPGSASTTIMSRAGCMRKAQAQSTCTGLVHVDVGIDHDHDLVPEVGRHRRQQGGPRASPAKYCFIAMTMRKPTPPEVGMATFSIVRNCRSTLLRKEFRSGSRSAAAGVVNRTLR